MLCENTSRDKMVRHLSGAEYHGERNKVREILSAEQLCQCSLFIGSVEVHSDFMLCVLQLK